MKNSIKSLARMCVVGGDSDALKVLEDVLQEENHPLLLKAIQNAKSPWVKFSYLANLAELNVGIWTRKVEVWDAALLPKKCKMIVAEFDEPPIGITIQYSGDIAGMNGYVTTYRGGSWNCYIEDDSLGTNSKNYSSHQPDENDPVYEIIANSVEEIVKDCIKRASVLKDNAISLFGNDSEKKNESFKNDSMGKLMKITLSEVRKIVRSILVNVLHEAKSPYETYEEISSSELRNINAKAYEMLPRNLLEPYTEFDFEQEKIVNRPIPDYEIFHDPLTSSFLIRTPNGEFEWNGKKWTSESDYGDSIDDENLEVRGVSGRDKRRAIKGQALSGWKDMDRAEYLMRYISDDDSNAKVLFKRGIQKTKARENVSPEEMMEMFPRRMKDFVSQFGSIDDIQWMVAPDSLKSGESEKVALVLKGFDHRKNIEYTNDGSEWEVYKVSAQDIMEMLAFVMMMGGEKAEERAYSKLSPEEKEMVDAYIENEMDKFKGNKKEEN